MEIGDVLDALLVLVGQVPRDRVVVPIEHAELFIGKDLGKKVHANRDIMGKVAPK